MENTTTPSACTCNQLGSGWSGCPKCTSAAPAHTPTPWYVERTAMQILIKATGDEVDGIPRNIAVTPGLNGNAEANAAFIVRACNAHEDLLARLKEIVKGCDSDMDLVDLVDAIRNVAAGGIAQADGR